MEHGPAVGFRHGIAHQVQLYGIGRQIFIYKGEFHHSAQLVVVVAVVIQFRFPGSLDSGSRLVGLPGGRDGGGGFFGFLRRGQGCFHVRVRIGRHVQDLSPVLLRQNLHQHPVAQIGHHHLIAHTTCRSLIHGAFHHIAQLIPDSIEEGAIAEGVIHPADAVVLVQVLLRQMAQIQRHMAMHQIYSIFLPGGMHGVVVVFVEGVVVQIRRRQTHDTHGTADQRQQGQGRQAQGDKFHCNGAAHHFPPSSL